MKICKKCKIKVDNDNIFCITCGNKIENVEIKDYFKCVSCNGVLHFEDKFCSNCGNKNITQNNSEKTITETNLKSNYLFIILKFLCNKNEYNFLEEYKDISDNSNNSSLNYIDIQLISLQERFFLLTISYLYTAAHKLDFFENEKIKEIQKHFEVTNKFVFYMFNSIKTVKPEVIFSGKTIISSILEPNNELVAFIEKCIFMALQEGSYIKKKYIKNLSPKDYEHPFDGMALDALENVKGFDTLVRKFNQYGIEKLLKIQYTGSNIKITEKNYPELYNMVKYACEIVNLKQIPDLYIELGFINAFTAGVEKPIIVLSSGCIGLLNYDELLFVIGHEIGHIKSQHVLYHQIGQVLPLIGDILDSMTLGIGGLISTGLQIALLNWSRKSEFTADRAGLLTCQNIDSAVSAMMKISGLPPKYYSMIDTSTFLKQAEEFESFDVDNMDKIIKSLSVMFSSHPWTVMRASELKKWIDSKEYEKILRNL